MYCCFLIAFPSFCTLQLLCFFAEPIIKIIFLFIHFTPYLNKKSQYIIQDTHNLTSLHDHIIIFNNII